MEVHASLVGDARGGRVVEDVHEHSFSRANVVIEIRSLWSVGTRSARRGTGAEARELEA